MEAKLKYPFSESSNTTRNRGSTREFSLKEGLEEASFFEVF